MGEIFIPGYVKWMSECVVGMPMTKGKIFKKPWKSHILIEAIESRGLFLGNFYVCIACGHGFETNGPMAMDLGPREYDANGCNKRLHDFKAELLMRPDGTPFGVHHLELDKTFIMAFDSYPPTEKTVAFGTVVDGKPEIMSMSDTWAKYRPEGEPRR